jgi:nickel-dependent lactate racemase
MGFMATVTVLLDGLHRIEEDPEFGKKLSEAVMRVYHNQHRNGYSHIMGDISSGGHCNVANVVEVHHADQTVYVRVGQNCGIVMDTKTVSKKYVTLHTKPVCDRWG